MTIRQPILYIHDALTDRVIGSRSTSAWGWADSRWPWISETVAAALDCEADELECLDMTGDDSAEHQDCIALNGDVVAYLDRN